MNELTSERLADIKGYMTNVNLPFRVQTDLPLLVAEVERLSYERNAIATRHSLLMKSYDEAFNDATKLRAQILINNAQWEKQHEATCDDLSAAQKRNDQLRQLLKKAHDAMFSWHSSEYAEHPLSIEVSKGLYQ